MGGCPAAAVRGDGRGGVQDTSREAGVVIKPCGAVYSWSKIGIIGKSVMPFRNIDRDW